MQFGCTVWINGWVNILSATIGWSSSSQTKTKEALWVNVLTSINFPLSRKVTLSNLFCFILHSGLLGGSDETLFFFFLIFNSKCHPYWLTPVHCSVNCSVWGNVLQKQATNAKSCTLHSLILEEELDTGLAKYPRVNFFHWPVKVLQQINLTDAKSIFCT